MSCRLVPAWTPQEREYLQGRYVESEILNHSLMRHPHVSTAACRCGHWVGAQRVPIARAEPRAVPV